MKFEWKKQEKDIYGVNTSPCMIDVPALKYITLSGEGDPNNEIFSEKVSALFSLAYKIKMLYKASDGKTSEINDYSVYPLEGIWCKGVQGDKLIKDKLQYTIMIRQPDFITKEIFDNAFNLVNKKKTNAYLNGISFETVCDGKCVQMLHKGSYDSEPASFGIMDRYCQEHGYKRIGENHREIYLSNAERTEKDKLKTILRYRISDISK